MSIKVGEALARVERATGNLGEPQRQLDEVEGVVPLAIVIGKMSELVHDAENATARGLGQCPGRHFGHLVIDHSGFNADASGYYSSDR